MALSPKTAGYLPPSSPASHDSESEAEAAVSEQPRELGARESSLSIRPADETPATRPAPCRKVAQPRKQGRTHGDGPHQFGAGGRRRSGPRGSGTRNGTGGRVVIRGRREQGCHWYRRTTIPISADSPSGAADPCPCRKLRQVTTSRGWLARRVMPPSARIDDGIHLPRRSRRPRPTRAPGYPRGSPARDRWHRALL